MWRAADPVLEGRVATLDPVRRSRRAGFRIATLSGSVGSTAERVEAARIAWRAGAAEVVNHLEVDGGTASPSRSDPPSEDALR